MGYLLFLAPSKPYNPLKSQKDRPRETLKYYY